MAHIHTNTKQELGQTSVVARTCGVTPCSFFDARSISTDADERRASMKKLFAAAVLCTIFMIAELICGLKSNSLSILTDAAHLFSDVGAFAISLFSLWASGWEANPKYSYGFFRVEILGALLSVNLIWLLVGVLIYQAVIRLLNGTGDVDGLMMLIVSSFGLIVNIVMALLLGHSHVHGHGHDHEHHDHDHEDDDDNHSHDHRHTRDLEQGDYEDPAAVPPLQGDTRQKKRHNINVQGAYLHVLGDAIQSIGVMIGGAIIWCKPEWKVVDLICTLVFSIVVVSTTVSMLRDIIRVLMEGTPTDIDATKLEKGLTKMSGVIGVHELHVWAATRGKNILSCHMKIVPDADADTLLDEVTLYVKREYNIVHATVQIER